MRRDSASIRAGAITGALFPIEYAVIESIIVRPYGEFLNGLIRTNSSNLGFSTQTGNLLASIATAILFLVCVCLGAFIGLIYGRLVNAPPQPIYLSSVGFGVILFVLFAALPLLIRGTAPPVLLFARVTQYLVGAIIFGFTYSRLVRPKLSS